MQCNSLFSTKPLPRKLNTQLSVALDTIIKVFVKVSQVDGAHEYLITRSEDLPNLSGETSMARGSRSTICHYYTTLHCCTIPYILQRQITPALVTHLIAPSRQPTLQKQEQTTRSTICYYYSASYLVKIVIIQTMEQQTP